MKHRLLRRLAPAAIPLGVLAALALAAPALADDANVTRSSAQGYPRSSDTPPGNIHGAPDGWGDDNSDGSRAYDTNWFIDAQSGDSDVVLLRVLGACIDGYGQVEDADDSDATHRHKEAWGEERLQFTVSTTAGQQCAIVVTNQIRFVASWALDGNGRNTMVLMAEALDIKGGLHPYSRSRTVQPAVTATTSESAGGSAGGGTSGSGQAGTDGVGVSAGSQTSVTESAESARQTYVTTSAGIVGDDSVEEPPVVVRFEGTTCSVKFASTELIDISAQAVIDGNQTQVRVPKFDTDNWVTASYVVDGGPGDPDAGPGTPGGSDPSGPTTPGGGPGGPGGGGGGTGPGTPGGDAGGGPVTPGGGTPGDGNPNHPGAPGGGGGGTPSGPTTPGGGSEPGGTPPSGGGSTAGGGDGAGPGTEGGSGGDVGPTTPGGGESTPPSGGGGSPPGGGGGEPAPGSVPPIPNGGGGSSADGGNAGGVYAPGGP